MIDDPVEAYLIAEPLTIGDLRDRALVSVFRDIRDLLAIIAGAYAPEIPEEETEEIQEVYVEDGRLRRRPVVPDQEDRETDAALRMFGHKTPLPEDPA
jgi:hypothetical protein